MAQRPFEKAAIARNPYPSRRSRFGMISPGWPGKAAPHAFLCGSYARPELRQSRSVELPEPQGRLAPLRRGFSHAWPLCPADGQIDQPRAAPAAYEPLARIRAGHLGAVARPSGRDRARSGGRPLRHHTTSATPAAAALLGVIGGAGSDFIVWVAQTLRHRLVSVSPAPWLNLRLARRHGSPSRWRH